MFDDTGLLKEAIREPTTRIETGWSKTITSMAWNPCVANLLVATSRNKSVGVFDVTTGEACLMQKKDTGEIPTGVSWDKTGTMIAYVEKKAANHILKVLNV